MSSAPHVNRLLSRQRIGRFRPTNKEKQERCLCHIWAGVFVLLVARFLFPRIHIALIDTDCVPVSLFEVPDLIVLARLQMSAHSVHTSPGGLDANSQRKPGMILFSEQFHDINAGLVFSIGDEGAELPDLSLSSTALMSELFQHRDTLLASTSPEVSPTEMFRQGTLLTPFLGRSLQECSRSMLGVGSARTFAHPSFLAGAPGLGHR